MTFAAIIVRIFSMQMSLMEKYKLIEQLPDPPISLHSVGGQRIIKDFAWRMTEELTEAFEHIGQADERDKMGVELADALHFLVEMLIFSGITPQQCLQHQDEFPRASGAYNADPGGLFWVPVLKVGRATHHLHNRPWKQTLVPTNEGAYRSAMISAYASMIRIWCEAGFTAVEMLSYYEAKHAINQERQAGKY